MTPGGEWVVGPSGAAPFDAAGDVGGHAAWIVTGTPGTAVSYLSSGVIPLVPVSRLTLSFDRNVDNLAAQAIDRVEVFDGANWVVVATLPTTTDILWCHMDFDVSRYANPSFKVRFAHESVLSPTAFARLAIDNVIVRGSQGTVVIDEDFETPPVGWTMNAPWGVGPATSSPAPFIGFGDPRMDGDGRNAGGLAGFVLAGTTGSTGALPTGTWYLTGPPMDLSHATSAGLAFSRRLNTDYVPYMESFIEVYDTFGWHVVWTNGTASIYEGDWTRQSVDLTPYRSTETRIRFGVHVNPAAYDVSSWSIDNVIVTATSPVFQIGGFETELSNSAGYEYLPGDSTRIAPWRVEGSTVVMVSSAGASEGATAIALQGGSISQAIEVQPNRSYAIDFDVAPDLTASGPVTRFVEVELVANDGFQTRSSSTYVDVPFSGQTATSLGWQTKSVGFSTGNGAPTGSARIRFRGVPYTSALGTVAIDNVRVRSLTGGQTNSPVASLTVRGNAPDGVPGPFLTAINKGEPIEFSFRGGAYVPFVFMAGPLAATPTPLSCAGTVDIGTPPFYDVIIIGNGLNFGLESLIFTLDGNGRANVTFSSWPLPVGTIFAVQAFIYPDFSGTCFGYLTAAHEIHVE
jgi:hypothetical protein